MIRPPSGQSSAPTSLNAIFIQALKAHHAGQLDTAAALYRKILSVNKTQFDTLHMLGVLEGQRGNLADGTRLIEKALKINPKDADAYLNLGRLQGEQDDLAEAEKNLRKALAIGPETALAYCNLSAVLDRLNRGSEALDAADRACTLAPGDPRAHFNRANAFFRLRRYEEAEPIYRKIVESDPHNADAWLHLAKTQTRLNKVADAILAFEKTAKIAPSLPGLGLSLGHLLSVTVRYEEALEAYDRELEIRPQSAITWFSRGDMLRSLKRHKDAIAAYDNALRFDRKMIAALGARVLSKMAIFDWKDIEQDFATLLRRLRKLEFVCDPMSAVRLNTSCEDQFNFAIATAKSSFSHVVKLAAPAALKKTDRIKIAYVSSDFGNHPVAQLLAGVLEHHDRSKFEIVAWPTMRYQVPLYTRIINAAEQAVDGTGMNDAEAARAMRDRNVQIAVDLNGHSLGHRMSIFAYRPAPVQVNFLGYPGTSGTDFIDYMIADRTVIPETNEAFYTERLALMPDSFLPADSKREIATAPISRRDAGLPENGFVFCSFNDPYKITPPLFDIWMTLLKQVEGSVLWLRNATPEGIDNLKRSAEARGVNADRLVFALNVDSNADHVARMALADVFLDTLPYNAHATANEALWAGLPVVTCLGKTFAGRVAASQIYAVGLPELVTTSWQDYQALAFKLAREPELLASIKAKLAVNRGKYPLFDTARYTRHLEQAYTTMWERALRGEAPASFSVQPD